MVRSGNSKAICGFEPGVVQKISTSPDVALMNGLRLSPPKASVSRDG